MNELEEMLSHWHQTNDDEDDEDDDDDVSIDSGIDAGFDVGLESEINLVLIFRILLKGLRKNYPPFLMIEKGSTIILLKGKNGSVKNRQHEFADRLCMMVMAEDASDNAISDCKLCSLPSIGKSVLGLHWGLADWWRTWW
eukprot:gene4090-4643_t